MRLAPTAIPDVLLLQDEVHADARGWFVETWSQDALRQAGLDVAFVQDNLAFSKRGVLRGLHLQVERPQGKLVRVQAGEVFDVVVDLRPASPTRHQWLAHRLRAEDHRALWVPPGLAHGYYVLSASAEVSYKVTAPWHPRGERVLRWDEPALGIDWPIPAGEAPLLSARDAAGCALAELAL